MSEYRLLLPAGPLGPLLLTADEAGLTGVRFGGGEAGRPSPLLEDAAEQLLRYLAGERTVFRVPLSLRGTPFQRAVWQALTRIPYGETRSYGEVAAAVGRPGAARAVGMACHANPAALIVPCHRVVGADGSLTGYAGGTEKKRFLLELEGNGRMAADGCAAAPR